MDVKKFYKYAKATWKEVETNVKQTGYEWLNGIAFHNYYKDWKDCYHSERVYVLATLYNWIKLGKLEEVK